MPLEGSAQGQHVARGPGGGRLEGGLSAGEGLAQVAKWLRLSPDHGGDG